MSAPSSPSAQPKCATCGTTEHTNRCSRCQAAWFCGADCQRKAWPTHKATCVDARTTSQAPPAGVGPAVSAPTTTVAAAPSTSTEDTAAVAELESLLADMTKPPSRLTDLRAVRRLVREVEAGAASTTGMRSKTARAARELAEDADASVATLAGAIPVLVHALSRHDHLDTALVTSKALQRMTGEYPPARDAIIAAGGVGAVVPVLSKHPSSLPLASALGGLLHNVSCSGDAARIALVKAGGIEALAAVAGKGAADADVSRLALSDLATAVVVSAQATAKAQRAGAVGLALRAISTHHAHAPIVTAAGILLMNVAPDSVAAEEALRDGAVPKLLAAFECELEGNWTTLPTTALRPGAVAAVALKAIASNATVAERVSRTFLALGGMALLMRTPTIEGGVTAGASDRSSSASTLEAALGLVYAVSNAAGCKDAAQEALTSAGGIAWLLDIANGGRKSISRASAMAQSLLSGWIHAKLLPDTSESSRSLLKSAAPAPSASGVSLTGEIIASLFASDEGRPGDAVHADASA